VAKRITKRRKGCGGLGGRLGEHGPKRVDIGVKHLGLVAEVAEEGGPPNAGPCGDLGDCHGVEASFVEQRQRGLHDHLAGPLLAVLDQGPLLHETQYRMILSLMQAGSYLVTGASTGIGRACVDRLVSGGAHVWATVRSANDEQTLQQAHGDKVSVLRVDITDDDSIAEAGAKVCAAGPLNGILDNAGIAVPAPLEYVPIAAFRRQIEVNLVGQLAITQAVLPALRAAREAGQPARIVMVGSIGGRIAGPMLGAYHVSKFALVGLADSLRAELAPSGIKVVLVEPGAVATPIWRRGADAANELIGSLPDGALTRYQKQIAATRKNAEASAKRGIAPERAAAIIVKAMTAPNPRPRILIGPDAHIASIVARLPFRLRYRLTAAKE